MVYKYSCDHCSWTIWSGSRSHLARDVKSHLRDHHTAHLSKTDFRVKWSCPYCVIAEEEHDTADAVETFGDHLYEHVESDVRSGVHVADEIDRTGTVLINGERESTGTDNARVHFLSVGDILVVVTNSPAQRVQLLDEQLDEWPAWTIIITSTRRPLSESLDIDFDEIPIEVVKLDERLGPASLGKTISRVLAENTRPGEKVSLEFDILPEIITSFDIERSVSFIEMLSSRLADADALSQFYIDPGPQSSTILNMIESKFDLEITASGKTFVTDT